MTAEQKDIHKRFLNFRERYRACELEFIQLLQEAERTKLHRAMKCRSLFVYAVDILTFSEAVAYSYIAVARKALEFPELLGSGLSISKASRIVSSLTKENAEELINFALRNTSAKIDREVARRNPKAVREKIKSLSEEFFELRFAAAKDFPEKLKRVESIQAQRGLAYNLGAVIEASVACYLQKFDPVEKAKRAVRRKEKTAEGTAKTPVQKLCLNRVRKPRTARENHAVNARDEGRCTHVDPRGKRCNSDRWVEIHHIKPVSKGGNNDPHNLQTLCAFHHDLVHQLFFALSENSVRFQ